MSRLFAPLIAFAAAGYVFYVNGQPDGRMLSLMGTEYLVGSDLEAQGRVTWQLLCAFGGFTLVAAFRGRADGGAED